MKKIDQIIVHPLFKSSMERIGELEQNRRFCCDGIDHSLDVARLAYIRVLEERLDISREVVYGAALLHDIGRWQEYEQGISHQEASERLAAQILEATDFDEDERSQMLRGIHCHRSREAAGEDVFARLLYEADKQSRMCWCCEAYADCYWPEEKKNTGITG